MHYYSCQTELKSGSHRGMITLPFLLCLSLAKVCLISQVRCVKEVLILILMTCKVGWAYPFASSFCKIKDMHIIHAHQESFCPTQVIMNYLPLPHELKQRHK